MEGIATGRLRCMLVLGRQGSGKGEQSERLARRLGFDHVSTGALLRQAIEEGTSLGRSVDAAVQAGQLVPDDLVAGVVAERLAVARAEGVGVVLDGYPRTVEQAQRLTSLLAPDGIEVAVHLTIPRSVALERLRKRRVCRACGATGASDRCPQCGSATAPRADDTDEAVGRRMSAYAATVGPLLEWLAGHSHVVHVDGVGEPDVVEERAWQALQARWSPPIPA